MTINANKSIKVLLVDDDLADRRLVKMILNRSQGDPAFEIDTAESLAETEEKLTSGNYDILLLDLCLPDSVGIETVEKVYTKFPKTAIVVLTGLDDEKIGLQAIQSGAQDYLVKGQSLQYTLIKTIKYAIQRKISQEQLEKTNQQLLKANQIAKEMAVKAESANIAKSMFLANMSHEIRTPMNAIIGFSEILSGTELNEEQDQYLKIIMNSSSALLELINDILDYSKIEAGKLEISKTDFNLKDLLRSIRLMMTQQAANKNINFDVSLCDEIPPIIFADSTRLRQCLINLANNAIKFTQQGHVYINVSVEKCECNGDFIRFDVEDTGIGIRQEHLDRIFHSFSQADGSTTRKYGGTGLGLTITKQLIELMGGSVSVTSEFGRGSVFTISIPLEEGNLQKQNSDTQNSVEEIETENYILDHNKNIKILVAEDNACNQKLIEIILAKNELDFEIVDDGRQAVDKALQYDFDLILMDMQMPVMNGYQATETLRKKGVKTPIIALTANAMKGDEEKCIKSGCDGYLPKPIKIDQLMETLKKHTGLKQKQKTT